jgi:hypothetical protein
MLWSDILGAMIAWTVFSFLAGALAGSILAKIKKEGDDEL